MWENLVKVVLEVLLHHGGGFRDLPDEVFDNNSALFRFRHGYCPLMAAIRSCSIPWAAQISSGLAFGFFRSQLDNPFMYWSASTKWKTPSAACVPGPMLNSSILSLSAGTLYKQAPRVVTDGHSSLCTPHGMIPQVHSLDSKIPIRARSRLGQGAVCTTDSTVRFCVRRIVRLSFVSGSPRYAVHNDLTRIGCIRACRNRGNKPKCPVNIRQAITPNLTPSRREGFDTRRVKTLVAGRI